MSASAPLPSTFRMSQQSMSPQKHPNIFPTIIVFLVSWVIFLILIGGAVCSDGWHSGSIGRSGACSHHGGVRSWPNVLAFFGSIIIAFKFHKFRNRNTPSSSHNINSSPLSESSPRPAPNPEPPSQKIKRDIDKKSNSCLRCGSNMVLRTAKKGRNTGNKFWGCSRYPRCKGTRPFESMGTTRPSDQ